jgi:hypothetical protein
LTTSLPSRIVRRVRRLVRGSASSAVTRADLPPGRRSRKAWLYEHQVPPERTVEALEGTRPGSRVLIVGTGPSARKVLPHDDRLHDRWDVVIGLNGSIEHLRNLDYFLSVESKAHLWDWYRFKTDPRIVRCVSESGARLAEESGFPDDQPNYFLIRHVYLSPVDIRHYRNPEGEVGLLVGPPGETGLGPGTVTLQAIHFAALLGASTIHVIGADMHFKAGTQHFYGENEYGTETVEGKRYHRLDAETRLNPIVEVTHPETGEKVETTLHFQESAAFLDTVIRDVLPPAGIELTDFSHGLISTARRADIDEYMAS